MRTRAVNLFENYLHAIHWCRGSFGHNTRNSTSESRPTCETEARTDLSVLPNCHSPGVCCGRLPRAAGAVVLQPWGVPFSPCELGQHGARAFFSVCACRSTARALSLGSTLLIGLIDDEATSRFFYNSYSTQVYRVPGTGYQYITVLYEYSRLSSSRHVSCHSAG